MRWASLGHITWFHARLRFRRAGCRVEFVFIGDTCKSGVRYVGVVFTFMAPLQQTRYTGCGSRRLGVLRLREHRVQVVKTASIRHWDTAMSGVTHIMHSSVSPCSDDPKPVRLLSDSSLSWDTARTDNALDIRLVRLACPIRNE